MANGNRRSLSITIVATVLMLISFGKGTHEQCVLRNTVVYEGELNTLLSCSNGPNGTSIVVRATSSSSTATQIDNYNDAVAPNLAGLYAINETGLIIRNATTLPTGGPISTAGFYIVSFDPKNSNNRTAFKLIVIRSGPTCYCSSSSQLSSVNISCQIIYADHPSYPINAVMSCSSPANGQSYNTTTPTKILIPAMPTQYVYNSTSTVTVNNPEPATYDCVMAFGKPGGAPPSYVALNAPDFSVNTQVFCGETTTASPTTTTTTQRTTTAQPSTTKAPTTLAATTTQRTTTAQASTTKTPTTIAATTQQTTTAEPQSTTTKVQVVTTTKPPTTLTIPLTTTTQPSTTVTRQLTTTAESLSSTIQLSSTSIIATQSTTPIVILSTKSTSQSPNATTLEPTTAKLTTTTTNQELALTTSELTNTSERPAASSSSTTQSSSSTSSEFKSTAEEELTTIPLATAPTTASIDVRLQSATIALATILATLMAAVVAVGVCWAFLFCCPLFSPISRPTRYMVDEMQRLPRREWIPAAREIRRLEYRVIPFYRQSFCKCPTPYEYRLPSQCRRVHACLAAQPRMTCATEIS